MSTHKDVNYLVKAQYLTITENKTIPPEDYGGWSLVNTGDVPVMVNGILLDPAGSVIGIDYTNLPPDVIWSSNISIRFIGNGTKPQCTLTRFQYSKINQHGLQ